MTHQAHNSQWLNGITHKGINYTGPTDLIRRVTPPPKVSPNTVSSRLKRLRARNRLTDMDIEHALYLDAQLYRKLYGQRETKVTASGKEISLNHTYSTLLTTAPAAVTFSTFRTRLVNRENVDDAVIFDAYSMNQEDWVSFYGGGRHRSFTYDGELYPEFDQQNFHSVTAFLKVIGRYEDKSLIWDRLKNNWPLDDALSIPRQTLNSEHLGRIYRITLKPTRQIYVGLTVLSPEDRWLQHLKSAANGAHNKLARAIQTNDADLFEIDVLEDCIPSGQQLAERECYWVRKLDALGPNGLNSAKPGGLGSGKGKPVTIGERSFPSTKSAGLILGKEMGVEPYVVESRIREGKEIPKTQRRHSKHPDAGTNLFRRHLALLARHKENIETPWLNYDSFKSDVGVVPADMKLVRKDDSKPWGPNNFEWMSSANAVKKVHGKPITIFDITYPCIEDAAAKNGIATSTLKYRIYKLKMSPEEAVSTPVRGKGNKS
ncbi:TPA: GIY-YIG nuclease family protein [Vibrio parahaemolyticus]|nr:GIY-YIG nuclease family protein [Vibrio parahaemolyticus]HCH1013528.1 GIY-YIG nuclease family protein [Vibrio parahaemolyticus]